MSGVRRSTLDLDFRTLTLALAEKLRVAARPVPLANPGLLAWAFEVPKGNRAASACARDLLSREEQSRHTDMGKALRRDTFAFGRAALRLALGQLLRRDPEKIPIIGPPGQKPVHPSGFPGFNISHSGTWVAVALSASPRIGIDIELRIEKPAALKLAQRFFDAEEARALEALPPAELSQEFLRVWTAKEALLKAAGGSVPTDLSRTRVRIAPGCSVEAIDPQSKLFEISGWSAFTGHIALLD